MRLAAPLLVALLLLPASPAGAEEPATPSAPTPPVSPEDRAQLVELNKELPQHAVVPAPEPDMAADDAAWLAFARRIARRLAPAKRWTDIDKTRPVSVVIQRLLPRHRRYYALQEQLQRLRVAMRDGAPRLKNPRYKVKVGVTAPEVGVLRERLLIEGYGDPSVEGRLRNYFDPRLKRALWAWQKAHGLPLTVWLDGLTLRRLNGSLDKAIARIGLAMARWRALDLRDGAGPQVLVHINEYRLTAERNGKVELTMPVVVGKANADDATPIVSSQVHRIVVNPSWHVPRRIVDETLRPRVEDQPDVARAEGFVVDIREDGSWRVRQPPGPDNPLGRLVFRMRGTKAVFLHDTPSRQHFDANRRSLSHGCVRVAKAEDLARWMLPKPQHEELAADLAQAQTKAIEPILPVPVHLVYQTVSVDEDGQLQLHPDIYGLDTDDALATVDVAGLLKHPPPRPEPPPEPEPEPTADAPEKPEEDAPAPPPVHGDAQRAGAKYELDVKVEPLDGGEPYSLRRYAGNILVVTFLSSWCENCRKLAPNLAAVIEGLRARGEDIVVLGVAIDEQGKAAMREYVKRYSPPYPVVMAGKALASGATPLGLVEKLPTTWVIGRTGVGLYRYEGRGISQQLAEDVERYLAAERRLK